MGLEELQIEQGKFVVVHNERDGVGLETLAELVGFDLEELSDNDLEGPLEEAWGGVIIGGDLTLRGNTTSGALPQALADFTGFPESEEGYFPVYFIVVLGNLFVEGNLQVEQYRDLYVKGNVEVGSFASHSANFVCMGTLTARTLICTNPTDEGGLFRPSEVAAPAWISTGDPNYTIFEDVELQSGEHVDASDETVRARASAAASRALEEPESESQSLFRAIVGCMRAGKGAAFLEAYRSE